jgi:glycosyl transferase family 2
MCRWVRRMITDDGFAIDEQTTRRSTLRPGITVGMASIPPRWRNGLAQRALASILTQTRHPDGLICLVDTEHAGAPVMRQRILERVETEWLAWVDDDDWLDQHHLRALADCAAREHADYVFSYPTIHGMADPWATAEHPNGYFGRPFDPAEPHHTTGIVLLRTAIARRIGYTGPAQGEIVAGEDWRMTLGFVRAGARIVHHPERTWNWEYRVPAVHGNVDGWGNTSGQGRNW